MSDPKPDMASLSPDKRAALENWLLQRSQTQVKQPAPTVPGSQEDGARPLSLAQESLWFFNQLEPDSPLYNIPEAWRLRGPLNVFALEQALQAVMARHDALRARFVAIDGRPMQKVDPEMSFKLNVIDLAGLPGSVRESEGARLMEAEMRRPFDLAADPLLRGLVLRYSADEHILVLTVHHIVADHSSVLLLHEEVTALYDAFVAGKQADLPPLPLQFQQFAACQRQRMSSAVTDRDKAYWKGELSGELPVLEMPLDFVRPAVRSFRGSRRKIKLSAELTNELKEFSKKENSSLYTTLLCAFQVLLHKYSQQEDIIIGAPVSARTQSNTEKLIGYFVNLLPIRAKVSDDLSLREFLKQSRQTLYNALAHQEVSIQQLVEDLKVDRHPGRNPLFQAVFQLLASGMPPLNLHGTTCEVLDVDSGTSKFDLTMTLSEGGEGLSGDIEFSTDLFSPGSIDRLIGHFTALLQGIVRDPQARISDLSMLTGAEQMQIAAWNNTATDYPKDATIAGLFVRQAAETPDAVAVTAGGRSMTYNELDLRSNQLAHRLRRLGVGPDVMVAICLERSINLVVGLLGILKAGGAYITLDASYPRERLAYMFADTEAPVFVTTSKFKELSVPGTQVVNLDEENNLFGDTNPGGVNSAATGDSLAYVTYTSGSTGTPKAVLIPNRGVVRLVKNTNYLQFGANDVFLQFAPISFDASTLEIWGPLLNGGKLVMFPPQFNSLKQLADVIANEGITTLWLTAGLFHQMVEEHLGALKNVKRLLAGGDVLSPTHVANALQGLPDTEIINGYGPTENTTFTCCYSVPRDWSGQRSVPVGAPISNTQVHLLDNRLRPVPIGIPGELYIGGDGLARGYLNAPELTSKKFIQAPNHGDARLYRTGDLARWLPDGNVEFLGRIDNQVKIRGFRIELSEIEAVLGKHDSVHQVTVIARQDGPSPKKLVAYVVNKPGAEKSAVHLRRYLEMKMPSYMIPSSFVFLENLPLTTNGKVDRRRLPAPSETESMAVTSSVAARSATEQKLLEIWKEVLGIPQCGMDDNFFELGGHSLLATRIVSRINAALGKEVPIRTVFEHPTIGRLAQVVDKTGISPATDLTPIVRRRRRPESANPSAIGAS